MHRADASLQQIQDRENINNQGLTLREFIWLASYGVAVTTVEMKSFGNKANSVLALPHEDPLADIFIHPPAEALPR